MMKYIIIYNSSNVINPKKISEYATEHGELTWKTLVVNNKGMDETKINFFT